MILRYTAPPEYDAITAVWEASVRATHHFLGADRVGVNGQNRNAVGFCRHMGFHVVGRLPMDGQGRPFPILHMPRLTWRRQALH